MLNPALLTPYKPVTADSGDYEARPDAAGLRIAKLLLAGKSPVLVGGAVGVGKTTELLQTIAELGESAICVPAFLDRTTDVRRLLFDTTLHQLVAAIADVVVHQHGLSLSEPLTETLIQSQLLQGVQSRNSYLAVHLTPAMLARTLVDEVTERAGSRRLVLLLDGLEKLAPSTGSDIFRALSELCEHVAMAVVVPWDRVYGPGASGVLSASETLVAVRPIDVRQANLACAYTFFDHLLRKRLAADVGLDSAPPEFWKIVEDAVRWSGGLPRTFLQIIGDCAVYGSLRGDDVEWPNDDDLGQALAEQRDSFLRLLLPGDMKAMKDVHRHSGREMSLDRKLRLLSHGLILERQSSGGTGEFFVHPLIEEDVGVALNQRLGAA